MVSEPKSGLWTSVRGLDAYASGMPAPVDIVLPAKRQPAWRRDDIQGLRAIAVLLVVAYHAGLPVPGGFVGVDIFFVISGFVITGLILRSHASRVGFRLRTFYARRMKRLLPALALMLAVTTVIAVFLESPFGQQQTTAWTSLGASWFVANFVIYANTGGYFDAPAEVNPLLHTWSLSVEEQFYFVFPSLMALAWFIARRRHGHGRAIAAAILVVLGIGSFVLSLQLSFGNAVLPGIEQPASWAFYSSVTRAWEFAVGALLALAVAHWPGRIGPRLAQAMTLLGAVLVIVAVLAIDAAMPFPGTVAIVPVVGTALLIAGGTTGRRHHDDAPVPQPRISRWLSTPVMVWIGTLSYSWYLWHWPVIVYGRTLWPGSETVLLALGIGSLLPAWLAYRYVEHPIHANDRIAGTRLVALVVAVIAVPSLLALGLRAGAEQYWRSPAIQVMADQVVPLPVSYRNGCDEGVPLGQQGGLDCTWVANAPGAPVYLIGDSEAGQLAEAVIGAGETLGRPVTIANMNSCPFLITTPDEQPLSAPDCQAFIAQSTDYLATQATPGTVVIGMSPNYVTADAVDALDVSVVRAIERVREGGHQVVLVAPVPQFPGWGPWGCSLIDTLVSVEGCGAGVPRSTMDNTQVLALDLFASVAEQTGARLLDVRDTLCPDEMCVTNSGDEWRFRDSFHITVGQSQALTLPMAGAIAGPTN